MRTPSLRRLAVLALLVLATGLTGCATLRSTGAGGAGAVWLWDNPRLAGNELRAVAFADAQEGWAVGAHGTILHTTNAGVPDTTYVPPFGELPGGVKRTRAQFSGTEAALNGVAIAASGTVWAVGDTGTIVRTTNSGQTWLPVRSGTSLRLNAVAAEDAAAWAVGERGTILSWNGSAWTARTSGTAEELLAVDFATPSLGWAGGRNRTLLRTADGGRTWSSISTTLPASAEIRGLSFTSADVGFAATWDGAEGALWRTADGGGTWAKIDGEAGTALDSVTASGTAEAWACGSGGLLLHADGSTVSTMSSCAEDLRGTCAAGGRAWAVGERGRVFGWEGSWSERSSIVTVETLRAYSALSQWAVGDKGTVVRWSPPGSDGMDPASVSSLSTTAALTAVAFVDSGNGWIAAEDGTVFTVTGGAIGATSSLPGVALTGVAATSTAHAWACGNVASNGYVFESEDGGSTWATATVCSGKHLYGISAKGDHVYAAGAAAGGSPAPFVAAFDGAAWSTRNLPGNRPLRAISAVSTASAVAVGDGCTFVRTIDGGGTWDSVSVDVAGDMNAVSFNGADGRAVGDRGAAYASSDGGATWTRQDAGTCDDLLAVDVSAGGRRAVGTGGCALYEVTMSTREVAGRDRYATAVEASRRTWGGGEATTAVLAAGDKWPDAVCGSSLAGAVGGPVLLTKRSSLPGSVVGELQRLGTEKVYVLGGTPTIDEAVVRSLATQMGPGFTVVRLAGIDRYETSAMIASATVGEIVARGGTYDGVAFLATGLSFPDALSAAPVAAHSKEPVLLTRPTGLSPAVTSACASLHVASGVILGGTASVPDSVVQRFGTLTGGVPARWCGADRYETSAEIARRAVTEKGMSPARVAFATGRAFPDALSGGVAQGHLDGPLLLSREYLPPSVGTFVTAYRPSELRFLGGQESLPLRSRNEAVWDILSGF